MMKAVNKFLFSSVAIMCMCLAVNGQVKITIPENATLQATGPVILINNGKLLSKIGVKSIYYSGINELRVKNDTVYVSVKDSVVKKLDKDKESYAIRSKDAEK